MIIILHILYGYLFACGMNLNSAGVCIFENFQRLDNARGEAERIIQPLEIFKNTHPLPNDRVKIWFAGWQVHCCQVGPYLGTRVPIGTFLTILVPKGSLFLSKVPISPVLGSCTRQKS